MYLGNFPASGIVDFKFTTVSSDGTPTTLSSAQMAVYKNNSASRSTAGISLTTNFDSMTGLNHMRIDTSQDLTFYAGRSDFQAVVASGLVGSVSVAGYEVGAFSINNRQLGEDVIAVRVLNYDWTLISGEVQRCALNALRHIRNKWAMDSNNNKTVYKEDDSTTAWTSVVSITGNGSGIIGDDPN